MNRAGSHGPALAERTGRTAAWSRGAVTRRFPVVMGVVAFAAMMARMLFPTAVGLADNGDGPRLMCHLGVVPGPDGAPASFDHAVLTYVTPADASATEPCTGYPSSTRLLMEAARAVTTLASLDGAIDLRVVIVFAALTVGATAAATCWLLQASLAMQGLATAGLLLITTDSAFALYAGSPFTETAAILGLTIMVPAAAAAAHQSASRRRRLTAVAVLALAGLLTVTAKVPMTTIAAPLSVFLCWLGLRRVRPPTRQRRLSRRDDLALRAACLVSGAVVLGGTMGMVHANPPDFRVINATDTLFAGVLPASDDPAETLSSMGLPVHLARYSGRSWWDSNPPQDDPSFAGVRHRITYTTIGTYLVTHPGPALRMADAASMELLAARPSYLGTFQVGQAPARAQECRVCVLSTLSRRVAGLGLLAVAVLTVTAGAATAHLLRRAPDASASHAFAAVSVLMLGIAAAQFVTATYGEAIETTKHMVVALMAVAFAFHALGLALAARGEGHEGGHRRTSVAPSAVEPAGQGGRSEVVA